MLSLTMCFMIAVKHVSKSFGSRKVLSDISFTVEPKEAVCIVGPGGSGKSTLLSLLLSVTEPSTGSIEVDGVSLASLPPPVPQLFRRRVGIIFQDPVLLAHLTIAEIIRLPLELFAVSPALIRRNTDDLVKRLGLTAVADRLPEQVSQSQRALAGIPRAVVTGPVVLIADEPLAQLDAKQCAVVCELIGNMHKRGTTTILFSRGTDLAHVVHARILHLEIGKITGGKAKEPVRNATTVHRILEEELPAQTAPSTSASGKRIRITAIGGSGA